MIEAQEQLKSISANQYSHETPQSKKKIHKELFSKAYPKDIDDKKTVITQQDLNKLLGVR